MADPSRDIKRKGRLALNRPYCRSSLFAPVLTGTREPIQTVSTRCESFCFFLNLLLLTETKPQKQSYIVNSSSSFPTKTYLTNLQYFKLRASLSQLFLPSPWVKKLNLASLPFKTYSVTHQSWIRKFLLSLPSHAVCLSAS